MLKKTRPSWVVAGVLVLFLICAIVLSGRPVLTFSIHQVHEIATLPDDPRLEEVRQYTYAGEIPYPAGRVYRYRAEQRQPLKVGWVYSEYGVFSMPFWAQGEGGPFVYIEGPEAIRGAFLSPSQLTMLEERGSGPIPREFSFPWYQHVWGWLLPILALVWFLLWRREDKKREAEHWGDEAQ